MRIVTGWRCTHCHPTPRSSIPPSDSGNTRERMALTTATFANLTELEGTLTRVFGEMQSYPDLIRPSLLPFC